jgi:hypothetical protein
LIRYGQNNLLPYRFKISESSVCPGIQRIISFVEIH